MIQLIKSIYLATTIAAVIAFILNYKRMNRFNKHFKTLGLTAVFNEDSLVCLLMCFIPIINIRYGLLYFNAAMFSDEDFEEYFKENDLEE